MESQAGEHQSCEDVRKSGYLRKQKSMHRRYFVLRAASERGPARLEYYESEKKFRGKAPIPKKALALETCFNINKRADSKNKHMIVLYTRAESFAIAAENEADQDEWYQAMVELQCKSKHTHTHTHCHACTIRTHAHTALHARPQHTLVHARSIVYEAPAREAETWQCAQERTADRDMSHSSVFPKPLRPDSKFT